MVRGEYQSEGESAREAERLRAIELKDAVDLTTALYDSRTAQPPDLYVEFIITSKSYWSGRISRNVEEVTDGWSCGKGPSDSERGPGPSYYAFVPGREFVLYRVQARPGVIQVYGSRRPRRKGEPRATETLATYAHSYLGRLSDLPTLPELEP